jgi:DNA polymerase-1
MSQRTSDSTLRYNAKDAFITLECANAFFAEIDKPSTKGKPTFRETYNHTMQLIDPCMYMQSRGVKVDIEALNKERINVSRKIDEVQLELNRIVGRELNPNSSDQLKKYFYVEKNIPPYTKLNNKKEQVITCDDKALQRLSRGTSARAGLREASLIQEYRKLSKLKGTYLDITFDTDKRLRCSYNPRGTRFARLSSSKTIRETGMNMQNLPPAFQSFLVADDDNIFLSLDKAQAEWVVVAYASGDENMISCLERGIDPHAYTASQMFKMPVDLIRAEAKILGHESDPDIILEKRMAIPELAAAIKQKLWLPRTMSMRQCGKKSNHGLNYDESPPMFSLINEITIAEAKVIVNFYHRTYPGIEKYYDHIKHQLSTNGRVLENLFGRPYRFLGRWDSDLWKSAYSYIPQSTIGELVNRSMCDIYYSTTPDTSELEILQQVHDSIHLQHPVGDESIGHAVLECKRHLEPTLTASGRQFIIPTDLKIGYNMRDMVEVPFIDDPVQMTKRIHDAAKELKQEKLSLS